MKRSEAIKANVEEWRLRIVLSCMKEVHRVGKVRSASTEVSFVVRKYLLVTRNNNPFFTYTTPTSMRHT